MVVTMLRELRKEIAKMLGPILHICIGATFPPKSSKTLLSISKKLLWFSLKGEGSSPNTSTPTLFRIIPSWQTIEGVYGVTSSEGIE